MEQTHTTDEVAEMLGMSRKTIQNYVKDGKLRAYLIGKTYRIPADSIREYIESTKVNFDNEKGE